MKSSHSFRPVILGTDLNAYNVARSFHMAYGVTAKVFGQAALLMVKDSKICDITTVDNFIDDTVMVDTLINFAKNNPTTDLFLFAASENYVFRIFENYELLEEYYHIPYAKKNLGLALSDKESLYEMFDTHGVRYPKTEIIHQENYSNYQTQLDFPIVIKPGQSTEYFNLQFEGKEKAYIIDNDSSLHKVLNLIYNNGYMDKMIAQEYVNGDISNEFVLNTYSDTNGKVRLMSLGRIVADDPDPELRGNYVAITNAPSSPKVEELYENAKNFLETIEYTGLSNFDFKFDSIREEFYAFEINLRQGRASFFSILAGAEFPQAIVNDFYDEPYEELVIADDPFIWINCTEKGFREFAQAANPVLYEEIKNISNIGDTLTYKGDRSFRRNLRVKKYLQKYSERLRDYI